MGKSGGNYNNLVISRLEMIGEYIKKIEEENTILKKMLYKKLREADNNDEENDEGNLA